MCAALRYTILLCLFLMVNRTNAQDLHFSQTTRATFQLNPAFIGSYYGDLRLTTNWKDQWQSINNTFRTYAAQIEYAFGRKGFKKPVMWACGGYFYKDASGDVQMGNTVGGLGVSSIVRVTRNSNLVLGIQGQYGQSGINTSNMQWGSQYSGLNYDPSLFNGEGIEYVPFNFFDMGVGVAYWFRKTDIRVSAMTAQEGKIGFSVYHLNRPSFTYGASDDTRLPMRFVGHASSLFGTRWENINWYPNATVAFQGKQHEVLAGVLWHYRLKAGSKSTGFVNEVSMTFGSDVRVTNVLDALVPQFFMNFGGISVGASYDVNLSKLRTSSQFRGGFELSLRFTQQKLN